MNEIIPLPKERALIIWNELIQSVPAVVPFSFNPFFFDFYRDYFRWKPFYFILYSQDEPAGMFPLVFTGKACVSLPHFSYGGLYSHQPVPDASSLVQRLVTLTDKGSLDSGFYRYDLSSEIPPEKNTLHTALFLRGLNLPWTSAIPVKETSFIELSGTKEEQWRRLSSNLRRKIRKAKKNKITFQQGGKELLNDFYRVYSRKMHQLGSPPYDKGFFSAFFQVSIKEGSKFFVAYSGSRPVGASLLLSYNGFCESAWFATEPSFHRYYVSDGLHWAMIKNVIKNGGRIYSMGRSTKNGSVYIYKNHWPVENHPLHIYKTSDRPSLKNHLWLSKLWRQVPLLIANWLGPKLVKNIY